MDKNVEDASDDKFMGCSSSEREERIIVLEGNTE